MSIKKELANVRALMVELESNGWRVAEVEDGEVQADVQSINEAMSLVEDVDYSVLVFKNSAGAWHSVTVILGNSPAEVIADWSFHIGDPDGFDALLGRVTQGFDS